MKVVIVGGVAGGASAAARLRRMDEHAEIIMLEKGAYISFANCGLPYYVGGTIADERRLAVQTPEDFRARFRVDVRTGHEATALDAQAKTLRVKDLETGKEYTETYDKLILAPGAEPLRPPLPGADDPRVFTLRTIPDTIAIRQYIQKNKPASAVVVGGGFIGLEMAENLAALDMEVCVVEMADHLLAPFDPEMAAILHHYLTGRGVQLYLNSGVQGFEDKGGCLMVRLEGREIPAGLVILAVGVRPESALARSAGLQLNERGGMVVNEYLQSSNADVYAVGDAVQVTNLVSGRPAMIPLAGPANKQGRIAADNICGAQTAYKGSMGAAVVKVFDMTFASAGLNEAAAQAAGLEYDKVYAVPPSHATYYPGSTNMFMKLLFEKAGGRVLGIQIAGFDGVDKRCDVVATAIHGGMTVDDLAELELCYAPPYSSAKDPVNMLGFEAQNVMQGLVKQYFWNEVDALPQDGSVGFLDVSNPYEYERGSPKGSVLIPLPQLRARMQELDKGKPWYVNCRSGMRSYVACRILAQHGYECYSLAGGWQLYEIASRQLPLDITPCYGCGAEIERP